MNSSCSNDNMRSYGFCDLNIIANGSVKKNVLFALKLGYQTVALSTKIDGDDISIKKGENVVIPPPIKITFTEKELKKNGIMKTPIILSRLTVETSGIISDLIYHCKDSIASYDIFAVTPKTEEALENVLQQKSCDIISLQSSYFLKLGRFRKALHFAIKNDIYFEISYSQLMRTELERQRLFQLGHVFNMLCRSRNLLMTSEARSTLELRSPYDASNLGRLFGLSHGASRAAVSSLAAEVIYCAGIRRSGVNKCSAAVFLLDEEENGHKRKFDSLVKLQNKLIKS